MSETQVLGGKPRRDWYPVFLSVISLALAVLVVLLVLQNRDLKRQLQTAATRGAPGGLAAGEKLSPFALADASGAASQVAVGDGHPRLFLVFTSTCPHCAHAIPIWRDLLQETGGGMEVVGVQMDVGAASAKPMAPLPFPVYSPGSAPPAFLTKLSGVPATIVVDGTGKVEQMFYGPPEGENKDALRQALVKARG